MKQFYKVQLAKGGGIADAAKFLGDPNRQPQVKMDGIRLVIAKDEHGKMSAYTRTISKKTGRPIRHTRKLAALLSDLKSAIPNGTVLDGELVAGNGIAGNTEVMRFLACSGMASDSYKKIGGVRYHYFDAIAWDKVDFIKTKAPFKDRYKHIATISPLRMALPLPVITCTNAQEKKDLYRKVVADGGEGLIFRDMNAPYYEGERTNAIIKAKEKVTYDAVIVGITPAKATSKKKGQSVATPTRIAGQVGDIRYGMYVGGSLVYLGRVSGFTDEVRRDLNTNWQHYVVTKRVLEIEGQSQNPSGAIKCATFKGWRDDKSDTECVLRE